MSLIVTVIINPASAGGKTGKHLSEIREKIRFFLGKQTKIRLTTKPNDATRLTKKALSTGCNLIVAVGGDGTINEVINGFFASGHLINSHSKLGIINCGTGSGLAQSLHLPDDLSRQFGIIKLGETRRIGGGMNLAPQAKLDDGNFNVLLIHGLTVPQRLVAFSRVYSGNHINNGKFSYFPAKYLNICSQENVLLETDGELLGNLPCSVEILPLTIPICSYN